MFRPLPLLLALAGTIQAQSNSNSTGSASNDGSNVAPSTTEGPPPSSVELTTITSPVTIPPWINGGFETFGIGDTSTVINASLAPGTTTITFTVVTDYTDVYRPRYAIPYYGKDGRCRTSEGSSTSLAPPSVTLVSQKVLTDGQTTTFAPCPAGVLCDTTYTGPTTVQLSKTTTFIQPWLGPRAPEGCTAVCGPCRLVYETVNVNFWPVSDANTACLSGVGSASSTGDASAATTTAPSNVKVRANLRPLVDRQAGNVSTVVRDGFTYVSPSVYIEFPTMKAWDQCGYLGPTLSNVVRSYRPEELSTLVYDNNFQTTIQPFNFKDADCPPQSVKDGGYWTFIAKEGRAYNPILSGPPDLTNLHEYWASCTNAPFQGNDPPQALTAQGGLEPNPTPNDPQPGTTTTAAGPGSTPDSPAPGPTAFEPTSMPPAEPITQPGSDDPAPGPTALPDNGSPGDGDSGNGGGGNDDPGNGGDGNEDPGNGGSDNGGSDNGGSGNGGSGNGGSGNGGSGNGGSGNGGSGNGGSNSGGSGGGNSGNGGGNDGSGSNNSPGSGGSSGGNVTPPSGQIQTITTALTADTVVNGQTFTSGQIVTVAENPSAAASSTAMIGNSGDLTVGSEVYTTNNDGNYIIDGQTLAPGEAVTVDGTTISLDATPTEAIIGTGTANIGDIIANPNPSATGASNLIATGGAVSRRSSISEWLVAALGSCAIVYLTF